MDVVTQIRQAMDAQGIGPVELSRRAGKASHRHVSDILRGLTTPGVETLQELATALQVELVVPAVPEQRIRPRVEV